MPKHCLAFILLLASKTMEVLGTTSAPTTKGETYSPTSAPATWTPTSASPTMKAETLSPTRAPTVTTKAPNTGAPTVETKAPSTGTPTSAAPSVAPTTSSPTAEGQTYSPTATTTAPTTLSPTLPGQVDGTMVDHPEYRRCRPAEAAAATYPTLPWGLPDGVCCPFTVFYNQAQTECPVKTWDISLTLGQDPEAINFQSCMAWCATQDQSAGGCCAWNTFIETPRTWDSVLGFQAATGIYKCSFAARPYYLKETSTAPGSTRNACVFPAPTSAPTTEAPTEAPTTEAPTTEGPTSDGQTWSPTTPTEAPTTEVPTKAPTEAPTTEGPTSDGQTWSPTTPTEAPTTEAPTKAPTEAPTTEGPTSDGQTWSPTTPTEAPTTETTTTTTTTVPDTTTTTTTAPDTTTTTAPDTTTAPPATDKKAVVTVTFVANGDAATMCSEETKTYVGDELATELSLDKADIGVQCVAASVLYTVTIRTPKEKETIAHLHVIFATPGSASAALAGVPGGVTVTSYPLVNGAIPNQFNLPTCLCDNFVNGLTSASEGSHTCAKAEVHGLSGVKLNCMPPSRPNIRHIDDGCASDTRRCIVSYTKPVFPKCGSVCSSYVNGALPSSTDGLCKKNMDGVCYPRNYFGDKKIGGWEFYGCPEDMSRCDPSPPTPAS